MSVDSWTLQVKSLEQVTQSVTVSSSASVLQLKDAIQPVFDVASNRQRLIFQGKVLKDGKQLTEYANLQDGKVIHMVSRPADAPSNAMNDEPQTNTSGGSSPQMFPGMFGPSEGYTFITVDANISDLGGNNPQALTSFLSGLFNGGPDRVNFSNGRTFHGGVQSPLGIPQNTRSAASNIGTRTRTLPTRDIGRNRRQSGDFSSLFDTARTYTSPLSALEIRLTRALAAIANIQTTLEAPPSSTDVSQLTWTSMSNATPEQTQAIRARLRANRSNGLAQTGLAVDRLADLMEALTPRLRQLAQNLQSETRPHAELMPELRRMITVIRSLSMVNHAIGNIMASSDDSSRRPGGLRSSPLGRSGRGTTTAPPTPSGANTRRRQQPSTSNQTNDINSNTTAATTPPSPHKRKLKSSTMATSTSSSSASSSSSSSPSSASACTETTKRQKTSNDSSDTNKDHIDPPAPSIATRKGKGNSEAKPNDN
ncbi:hypothetical protein BCR42DRAFT_453004 [Absidia repens]|uniref:Ubiquitin-like domain-containing protein n=1 Tax=Absidia repens TaxID=90262 RepID=A0A1X2IC36_9FUNG|nr:hypothetical protein BCR42DRAFT_453004 [Absidia repens]